MVSPSKAKQSTVASQQNSSYKKCKLIKGTKPLLNFKFYLDIERHNISSRIETKIKELGGSIEFFLDNKVTHFVTDKNLHTDFDVSPLQTISPRTPYLLSFHESTESLSPDVNNFQNDRATGSKSQSRADAMLQRARSQTFDNTFRSFGHQQSPIYLAKSWGTPIWSTEHATKFLDKVQTALKTHTSHCTKPRTANVKHLKGDYIKLDSFQKQYRPYYVEIKHWPIINLLNSSELSAFYVGDRENLTLLKTTISLDNSKEPIDNSKDKMTRAGRKTVRNKGANAKITTDSEKPKCGYCELCCVEYDILSVHLQTKEHVNFVGNSNNYTALDSLIETGANVVHFLRDHSSKKSEIDSGMFGKRSANKKSDKIVRNFDGKPELIKLNDKSNGPKIRQYTPPATRRSCGNHRNYQRSPDVQPHHDSRVDSPVVKSDFGEIKHRARRESMKKINYAEPREDEENVDEIIQQSAPIKYVSKTKIRTVRWRPPSPDAARPHISEPIVYEVIGDTTNTDKTYQSIGKAANTNVKEPLSETNNKSSTGLIVKFKRVRTAEIDLLNMEADSFMFPKSRDELPTDEDRQSTSDPADISADVLSSSDHAHKPAVQNKCIPPNVESDTCDDLSGNRKKRRNQLESFLCDNNEYYKFEKPDTRLRFQEAPIQPFLNNGLFDHTVNTKERRTNNSISATITSSMQCLSTEDGMGEKSTKNKNGMDILRQSVFDKHRFSFERIPSSEPWYDAFRRQDECEERVFQYWGSTVYRKLPFEMGPLPALQSDCCILSKLLQKDNKTSKHVGKRGKKPAKGKKAFEDANLNTAAESQSEDVLIPPVTISDLSLKMNDNAKIESSDDAMSMNVVENSCSPECRRQSSILNGEPIVKSAISDNKRNSLLDSIEQPRKSPREHASTLAILSCLIQQRRKRENESEINGKCSNKNCRKIELVNKNVKNDIVETNKQNSSLERLVNDVKKTKTDNNAKEEIHVSDENKAKLVNTNESDPSQSINSITPVKTEPFEYPKIPIDNYVNPLRVCKEIDKLLNSVIDDSYDPNLDIEHSSFLDIEDVDLLDCRKDISDIIDIVDVGPLRCTYGANMNKRSGLSSFGSGRGRKRKNNKTGWPNIPKRKIIIKKEKVDEASVSNSDEEFDSGLNDTDKPDIINNTSNLYDNTEISLFSSKHKIIDPVRDESSIDDIIFTSSSDKAEYSDIFTVSSDSVETTMLEVNDFSATRAGGANSTARELNLSNILKKQIGRESSKRIRTPTARFLSSEGYANYQPFVFVKRVTETDLGLLCGAPGAEDQQKISKQKQTNGQPSPTKSKKNNILITDSYEIEKVSPRKLRKPRGRWYRER